ncbi:hypothetical protein GCM10010412_069480 [Nonomuraea recticatena]|uniref:Exo-alpha-sialidase n=2 Tax=Nonomuraea recticatena TaxID=46178 RepID=A0ABP6F4F9_9ACTN
MGFTVVGPKTFLASGHPGDASADASPHLGLIRTTDGGRTWTTVSGEGVADFHAIQLAVETLYAYDSQSGQLRRSADGGETWMTGAEEPMNDLAGDRARVFVTTPQGLKVSGNGGMEFEDMANAPLLSHVESPVEDVLIGPGPDGRIHTSRDGGKSWQDGGKLPGPVTAFTAVDVQRLLAATEDGTVMESKDGGKNFAVAFRPANG